MKLKDLPVKTSKDIPLPYLGEGASRITFKLSESLVLKYPKANYGELDNTREYLLYKKGDSRFARTKLVMLWGKLCAIQPKLDLSDWVMRTPEFDDIRDGLQAGKDRRGRPKVYDFSMQELKLGEWEVPS